MPKNNLEKNLNNQSLDIASQVRESYLLNENSSKAKADSIFESCSKQPIRFSNPFTVKAAPIHLALDKSIFSPPFLSPRNELSKPKLILNMNIINNKTPEDFKSPRIFDPRTPTQTPMDSENSKNSSLSL